jgi:hypothetical protein
LIDNCAPGVDEQTFPSASIAQWRRGRLLAPADPYTRWRQRPPPRVSPDEYFLLDGSLRAAHSAEVASSNVISTAAASPSERTRQRPSLAVRSLTAASLLRARRRWPPPATACLRGGSLKRSQRRRQRRRSALLVIFRRCCLWWSTWFGERM